MVEVKEIEKKGRKSKILLKSIDAALLNSVRRTVMKDLPILAIENVNVYENNSVLFDEFLAHRLGLLPVSIDFKNYKPGDKVKFSLNKEGPGVIHAGDLKCADPKIEITGKKIPLVTLKKDQRVKLEMEAVVGTGEEHVKWQPAIIGYHQLASISTEKGCNLCEECVKACPKGVLEIKARKVVLSNPLECILCGKCRDVCKYKALKLEYDKNSFILNIENHGGTSNAAIMTKAVSLLADKVKEFQGAVKKI